METKWNDHFVHNIERNLERNMKAAGFWFVSWIRVALNRAQPRRRYSGVHVTYKGLDPSRPGDRFPKKLTGQLIRSIAFNVGNQTLTVGSGLNYAGFLQQGTRFMQARPWLTSAYEDCKDQIARIILTGGK